MERYPDLLAQGFSRSDIDSRVRNQELRRIRRGVFIASTRPETPEAQHLELLAATIPHLASSAVLSHSSAGVLHDLPVPLTTLNRVHITRSSGGRISRHTYRHEAPLPADSVTEIKGYQVTSLARTVVDLARWLEYADGVSVVDAVLRQGVHREELLVEIERARRRHGNVRAREAVVFGDGRAESPGESRSRVMMARLGLPMPNLQKEFRNEWGEVEARVDFDWEEYGASGEFDGKDEYGRLLRPGGTTGDAVMFEKAREEVVRRHGRWIFRWNDAEAKDPKIFKRIIEKGLANGLRRHRAR